MDANPDGTRTEAAVWWLTNNDALWGEWVTDDAEAAVKAALTAGEEAEGWPDE